MKTELSKAPIHRHLSVCVALLAAGLSCHHACAGQAQFFDLGQPFPEALDEVHVTAVSADGIFAVGYIDTGPGLSFFPVYWDVGTGAGKRLPESPDTVAGSVVANGIKDDNMTSASVIVGTGANAVTSGQSVMVRWVDVVPEIPNGAGSSGSESFGLSGDGEVIVGRVKQGNTFLPARWDPIAGIQEMSPLVPGTSGATPLAASYDGTVIAGFSPGPLGGVLPVWWNEEGAANFPQFAALLEGSLSSVSGDGQRLGGEAFVAGYGRLPTLWDRSSGAHRFLSRTVTVDGNGVLVGGKVTAMSTDGTIVGLNSQESGIEGPALWTEAGGLRNLRELLEVDHGIDLSNWDLSDIADIGVRPDGSITVVGRGKFFPDPANQSLWQMSSFSATFPHWSPGTGTFPEFCDVDWQAPANLAAPGLRILDPEIGLTPELAYANALVAFNGELYAIGHFTQAGGVSIGQGIARWNGSVWRAVGGGLDGPESPHLALDAVVYDDGRGPALYVAGNFLIAGAATTPGLARWDGSQWSNVGTQGLTFNGNPTVVRKLVVFDDGNGPALYAAGAFNQADGVAVNGLARWDGNAWTSIGSPDDSTTSEEAISSLAVYDDGNGPALYVAGQFQGVAGVPAIHLARWNGQDWAAVGGGVLGFPSQMVAFDDGHGAALYLGVSAPLDSTPVNGSLLRWNGQQFESYGHVTANSVVMKVLDDGLGPALLIAPAGGWYADFDGAPLKPVAYGILRWDGQKLTRLGKPNESMVGSRINALASYDDGNGMKIYVGGDVDFIFDDEAGDAVPAENIGRLRRCGYSVGGTVTGLIGHGLALSLNDGSQSLPVSSNGGFTFPTNLRDGETYDVTIAVQPDEPHQSCEVADGSGSIAGSDIANIDVTCLLADLIFVDGFE